MNWTKVKLVIDIISLCCGIILLTDDGIRWMGIIITIGSMSGIYDAYKKLRQK